MALKPFVVAKGDVKKKGGGLHGKKEIRYLNEGFRNCQSFEKMPGKNNRVRATLLRFEVAVLDVLAVLKKLKANDDVWMISDAARHSNVEWIWDAR